MVRTCDVELSSPLLILVTERPEFLFANGAIFYLKCDEKEYFFAHFTLKLKIQFGLGTKKKYD